VFELVVHCNAITLAKKMGIETAQKRDGRDKFCTAHTISQVICVMFISIPSVAYLLMFSLFVWLKLQETLQKFKIINSSHANIMSEENHNNNQQIEETEEEEEIEELVLSGTKELNNEGYDEDMMRHILSQMNPQQGGDEDLNEAAFETILSSVLGGLSLDGDLRNMFGVQQQGRPQFYDDESQIDFSHNMIPGEQVFHTGGLELDDNALSQMMMSQVFAPESMQPAIDELKGLLDEWLNKEENKTEELAEEHTRVTQIRDYAQQIVDVYRDKEYPESLSEIMDLHQKLQDMGPLPDEVATKFDDASEGSADFDEEAYAQEYDKATSSCQTQ
jgi:hypothetical protein